MLATLWFAYFLGGELLNPSVAKLVAFPLALFGAAVEFVCVASYPSRKHWTHLLPKFLAGTVSAILAPICKVLPRSQGTP